MLHTEPREGIRIALPRALPKSARLGVEAAIEQHLDAAAALMAFLDALDGDTDLEPSICGGFDPTGANITDDREADIVDELHDPDPDREPSLGSMQCVGYCGEAGASPAHTWDQTFWARGGTDDRERADDSEEGATEDLERTL
jgi:hypothetical protein